MNANAPFLSRGKPLRMTADAAFASSWNRSTSVDTAASESLRRRRELAMDSLGMKRLLGEPSMARRRVYAFDMRHICLTALRRSWYGMSDMSEANRSRTAAWNLELALAVLVSSAASVRGLPSASSGRAPSGPNSNPAARAIRSRVRSASSTTGAAAGMGPNGSARSDASEAPPISSANRPPVGMPFGSRLLPLTSTMMKPLSVASRCTGRGYAGGFLRMSAGTRRTRACGTVRVGRAAAH